MLMAHGFDGRGDRPLAEAVPHEDTELLPRFPLNRKRGLQLADLFAPLGEQPLQPRHAFPFHAERDLDFPQPIASGGRVRGTGHGVWCLLSDVACLVCQAASSARSIAYAPACLTA